MKMNKKFINDELFNTDNNDHEFVKKLIMGSSIDMSTYISLPVIGKKLEDFTGRNNLNILGLIFQEDVINKNKKLLNIFKKNPFDVKIMGKFNKFLIDGIYTCDLKKRIINYNLFDKYGFVDTYKLKKYIFIDETKSNKFYPSNNFTFCDYYDVNKVSLIQVLFLLEVVLKDKKLIDRFNNNCNDEVIQGMFIDFFNECIN